MPALLVLLCIGTLTVQSIFTKQYNLKCPNGEFIYSTIKVLFALLFFIVTGLITKQLNFSTEIIPYSIAFAIVYTLATIGEVLSIKTGSLAITSLIISYSLLIPTIYGLIFQNEKLTYLKGFGIGFLLLSLFLIREKMGKSDKGGFSVKWLIYVTITFFTNGLCSVFQTMQSKKFEGAQDNNFMIYSLLLSFVVLIILSLVFNKKVMGESVKKGFVLAAASGICNGATNLLVMLIVVLVSASVFFPVLSAGGLVVAFFVALIFYKEKFIPRQIVGLSFGLVALVLLNI